MECLPLRPSAAPAPFPFHHLISEHSKSLVALQELQHEVGALLEFRDLVIETFPSLRTKLGGPGSGGSSAIPVPLRRDWEPGVRVRRRLHHKDEPSSPGPAAFARSRSNSHSGKQPKSGSGDGASVIQDSGFSTETSSSKETPSACSTAAMATTSAPHSAPPTSTAPPPTEETEDELWNLLDVIHRKGTRLKDEAEALQGMLREQSMEPEPCEFQRALLHASVDDVRQLRRERDILLDRVAEMEAETLAGRVHTSRLQSDLENLLAAKQDLEEQLRTVISQKTELNSRIHDMHVQFVSNKSAPSSPDGLRPEKIKGKLGARAISVESLDSVLGTKFPRVKVPDSKRIAAILLEHDPIVLQRHLLSTTVQNQLLQQRLELIIRTKNTISKGLDKAKEENEDLRFQLEDRNIELEGTRARVRLLEQLQLNKPIDRSPDIIPIGLETNTNESRPPSRSEILSASMKAMSPLPINLQMDHSSSTESAHDQTEQNRKNDSKNRRPSRIPLPGVKSYAAPKPPVGRQSPGVTARSRSGGSPGRPTSAHSWRNKSEGNSLSGKSNNSLTGGNKSRNGSLTARNGRDSLKNRDSLSGKLRSNDSLSKHRDSSANASFKRDSSAGKQQSTPVRRMSNASSRGSQDASDTKSGPNIPSRLCSFCPTSPQDRLQVYKVSQPWIPMSYNSDIDLCPDSLEGIHIPLQPHTIGFGSSDMFIWNTSPTSEYFDSIESASINLNNCSMLDSSLYQENGEDLAECDSLEKDLSGDSDKEV